MSVSLIESGTGKKVPRRTFSLPDPAGAGLYTLTLAPDGRSYAYMCGRVLDDLYLVDGLE
jgi:hypothetical protein